MLREKLRAALFVPGERKSDRFFRWFPWIWLVAGYCITMLVLCLHGRAYIDSDMASEMILSDILNKEGGLLTTQWWYSTELQVFCLQPLYRIGLLLFPHSWFAARMLGQGAFLLLLVLSYLYAGHGLGLKQCGVWGAAALVCPFGVCYLWYGLLGGFYLPYMILLLLAFGAILHLLRPAGRKRRVVQWLLLLAVSGIFGLNGLKGLMGFYIPMVLTALAALLLQWHQHPEACPAREKKLLLVTVAASAVAVAGYGIYEKVLVPSHQTLSYDGRLWNTFSIQAFVEKLADFLTLFGYPIDSSVGGEVELFSLIGILCAVGLVTAGAIVFSLVRLLQHWKELQPIQLLAPLLLGFVCLEQGAVFAWTGKLTDTNPYQWLTIIPLVFPVLQLEGETEHFRVPHARRAAAMAFCVCFVAVSIGSGMRYFTSGYRVNPHLAEVCDWLVDNGYTQGYASFWNGNVLTEWSDGQIEVWVPYNFNTMQPYEWLQKTSHANPPEGQIFLLTTMDELGSMNLSQLYWWSTVVYEDGDEQENRAHRYVVMVYKNYEDMMAAIHGAQSWAATPEAAAQS